MKNNRANHRQRMVSTRVIPITIEGWKSVAILALESELGRIRRHCAMIRSSKDLSSRNHSCLVFFVDIQHFRVWIYPIPITGPSNTCSSAPGGPNRMSARISQCRGGDTSSILGALQRHDFKSRNEYCANCRSSQKYASNMLARAFVIPVLEVFGNSVMQS
jgi:hypothetical protein